MRDTFLAYLSALRRQCPCSLDVTVRRKLTHGSASETVKKNGRFWITIGKGDVDHELDSLNHEWPHAMEGMTDITNVHNAAWGVYYAECRRVLDKILEEDERIEDAEAARSQDRTA